jgi:hypothetical protein
MHYYRYNNSQFTTADIEELVVENVTYFDSLRIHFKSTFNKV